MPRNKAFIRMWVLFLSLSFVPAMAGCDATSTVIVPPTPMLTPTPRTVQVIEHAPPDLLINTQGFKDIGCDGELKASCTELIALGCDTITSPNFHTGGLQPSYGVMTCIHKGAEPPNSAYFKLRPGLDPRYHSYVIYQDGVYRLLIKRSEFKDIFAPIESLDEAISYAAAMTSLVADYYIQPEANVEYLVDVIEETHAEETPEGYLVYLFDDDRKFGCDTHSYYAVAVLVTREGDVSEVERREIYRRYVCTDFGRLTLDED